MDELEKVLIAMALNGLADGLLSETDPCGALETATALDELAHALRLLAKPGPVLEAPGVTAWDDPIWPPGSEVN